MSFPVYIAIPIVLDEAKIVLDQIVFSKEIDSSLILFSFLLKMFITPLNSYMFLLGGSYSIKIS